MFVRDNSNIKLSIYFFYNRPVVAPSQINPKSFESRWNVLFLFLAQMDEPCVYLRAWTLCCFHSLNTQTFLRELIASAREQLHGDKDLVPFQWRNRFWQSLEEIAGKAMLGVCIRSKHIKG